MRKAVRLVKLAAIVMSVVFLLSACGAIPSSNTSEPSANPAASPTATPAKQQEGGKFIIESEKYGFELEAPKFWEGKVKVSQDDDFKVTHKTISKNAAVQNPPIFTVVEYGSKEKWEQDSKKQDQPFPYEKLGEIDGKVYAYILPFDVPYDDKTPEDLEQYTSIMNQVQSVLKTFRVTGSSAGTGKKDDAADNKYAVAGIEDAAAFEQYFNSLKQLIARDDKKAVADSFIYPVSIVIDDKKTTFQNADEMVAQYDKVFTDKVKEAVAKQKVEDLFVNYQGVMVGNGELWLGVNVDNGEEYYILSVNP